MTDRPFIIDDARLKAELQKPGRSQSGLARYLGIDQAAVNRMVNGKRDIKARELEKIGQYLADTFVSDGQASPELIDEISESMSPRSRAKLYSKSITTEVGLINELSLELARMMVYGVRQKMPSLTDDDIEQLFFSKNLGIVLRPLAHILKDLGVFTESETAFVSELELSMHVMMQSRLPGGEPPAPEEVRNSLTHLLDLMSLPHRENEPIELLRLKTMLACTTVAAIAGGHRDLVADELESTAKSLNSSP